MTVVVDLLWRRKRRPKDVLLAHGKAYVEAPIKRAVPAWLRGVSALIVVGSAVVSIANNPSRLRPTQVPGFATSRGVVRRLRAVLGTLILFVVASNRHLQRRIDKANDPAFAGFSVPTSRPRSSPGPARSPRASAGSSAPRACSSPD